MKTNDPIYNKTIHGKQNDRHGPTPNTELQATNFEHYYGIDLYSCSEQFRNKN